MKIMKRKLVFSNLSLLVSFLVLAPAALASTTWYVNGVTGSDSNNCLSPTTACKTIGHVISLASSGDSIIVAAATYRENLTIRSSLTVTGAGAKTTIIDGGGLNSVVTIAGGAQVKLSSFTIRNGSAEWGGGIFNNGTVKINNSSIAGNISHGRGFRGAEGGGIINFGTLVITNGTLSGNSAMSPVGGVGGGISNGGTAFIVNSTIAGNTTVSGGGIVNGGTATISNSTISNNTAGFGGGIYGSVGTLILQNSILANNSHGNCEASITSDGYNLSSDASCNLNGPGDLNNTNPQLGPLKYNGGPTKTMALPSGSPAVDAGNPSGCTDGLGHLLKTDQRGKPRPDTEDTGGCDMGAYERQSD